MQIAIVDDRAEDREELSACLENYMKKHQLDYTLTEFEDGENFLKAAAQVNFQLVFMDIYMENMDGIEAARRLRQKNRLFVRSFSDHYRRLCPDGVQPVRQLLSAGSRFRSIRQILKKRWSCAS